jgi:hypothetical protein
MEQAPLLGIKRQRPKNNESNISSSSSWYCCCSKRGPPPRTDWPMIIQTAQQSKEISDLKNAIAEETYNKDDSEHTELWRSLWSNLNEDSQYPGDIGEHWVKIGFQQKDPSSDLRAAGVSGLRHLVNFVENESDFCKSVLIDYPLFPLCVAGLNVSHCLFYHLKLYNKASVPPYGSLSASSTRFLIGNDEDRIDLVSFASRLEASGSDRIMQHLYTIAFKAVIKEYGQLILTESSDSLVLKFNSEILPHGWLAVETMLVNGNSRR